MLATALSKTLGETAAPIQCVLTVGTLTKTGSGFDKLEELDQ